MEKKNYSAPAAEIKELSLDIVLASLSDDEIGWGPVFGFHGNKEDTPKARW